MASMDDRRRMSFLLGVGLDGRDGHHRATKGEDYLLVGGSEETHEQMQEGAEKIREVLDRRGKRLRDVDSREELRDIAREAGLIEKD
jgi:hypothetical protein